jgi:hypothetical protein
MGLRFVEILNEVWRRLSTPLASSALRGAGVGFSFDELSGRWSLVGMNVSCGGAAILRAISCKLLGADLL